MKFYFINPFDFDKQNVIGYFKYKPCKLKHCKCTTKSGWGVNFLFFGFNVESR